MKENIEDYRRDGIINLDEYFLNNPSQFTYPYFIEGYNGRNFWTKVGREDTEKFIYVKPKEKNNYLENDYNVYSRLLYEELMKQVGIDTVSSDLAQYDGNLATISNNILEKCSYDEFIITASELIESKRYPIDDEEYNIEDLFDSIHEYCLAEDIDEEVEKKCISDIQKVCIADIFSISTDRKVTDLDFIVGKNENGEDVLRLAPLSHNTYCLGSNFSEDEIYDMLENDDMLADRVGLCYSDAGVPEFKREYDYPYWEDSLYYFIDEDNENLAFARKCANSMNIDLAIKNVENKIKDKIPAEYKEFARVAWDNRLQNLCECIGLDYYKVMDNKYYKEEMEEI